LALQAPLKLSLSYARSFATDTVEKRCRTSVQQGGHHINEGVE
jgi:hypothetical protein